MKQYEVWWAELPPPAGRRPILLLSRDSAYDVLNKYIAAETTTTIRDIPIEVRLGRAEGMPKSCVANLDNLRTISRTYLQKRIGHLGSDRARLRDYFYTEGRKEAMQNIIRLLCWSEQN